MSKILNLLLTILLGAGFGFILIESQAISWYRIQEMFYFQSFHMYGLLSSAVLTGALSIFVIKKLKIKNINKKTIVLKEKPLTWKANLFGGILFGFGWGLTGACSAPLFILIGVTWKLGLILFLGALIGTFFYALLKNKLPHE